MRQSTIGFAPLRNLDKALPQRAEIPDEVMIPSTPPSFLALYGNFIFIMLCVIFATLVIQPELEKRWDVESEADRNNFIAVYVVYGLLCLALFIFII